IGEFFHWADARWQWRQPPGLNQVRRLSLGRASKTGNDTENPDQRGRQTLDQITVHLHGAFPSLLAFLGKSSRRGRGYTAQPLDVCGIHPERSCSWLVEDLAHGRQQLPDADRLAMKAVEPSGHDSSSVLGHH